VLSPVALLVISVARGLGRGVRRVREYIKSHQIKITPAQLALLVPCFDSAWAKVQPRLQRLHPEDDERAARDRLASAVVDIVITSGITEPAKIAARAIRRVLAHAPPRRERH
jgi:hypothetical protein